MKIFLVKSFFKKNDLEYNFNKIISLYKKAEQDNCDLLIFSEMCITGFPIYDELLNLDFLKKTEEFLEKIVDFTKDKKTRILLGCPYFIPEHKKNEIIKKSELFNSVVLIGDGYINAISSKTNILKSNLFDILLDTYHQIVMVLLLERHSHLELCRLQFLFVYLKQDHHSFHVLVNPW